MYVAQNVCSNVRELEGCLTRLTALASVTGSPITIEFARQALRDLIRTYESKPDVEAIQRVVSDRFHIRLAELKSKKRTQRIAFCRQVAMYLCRKITSNSFPNIGEHFGRDHSTVIHAFNLIERRVVKRTADEPVFAAITVEIAFAQVFDPNEALCWIVKINLRHANSMRVEKFRDLDVMPIFFVLQIVFDQDHRLIR